MSSSQITQTSNSSSTCSVATCRRHCHTFHGPGDADLLIVQKAVESATTTNTLLIGDDTDLLILLIYHTNLESHDLFFKLLNLSQRKALIIHVSGTSSSSSNSWVPVCQHILFIHAILGCDTTSSMYGIGKGAALML